VRVKKGVTARRRHKKIIKQAKGMTHVRRTSSRMAKQAVTKSLSYAYRDRRNRKRDFRSLWVTRINAAARSEGLSYSQLIKMLNDTDVQLDRKILAELAVNYPEAFKEVVKAAKAAKPKAKAKAE
jgi:large subunit ribosomal protein L20